MKHARNSSQGNSSGNRKSPRQTSLSQKSSTIAKKKTYKKKKRSLAGLKAVAVILLIAGLVVILGVGSGMYAAISKEIDAMDFDSLAYNFSSTLFADDTNGNSHEIAHLTAPATVNG